MPTNIKIEINATVVAKEIDPENPERTIDQTTHAEPMIFEGQRLRDFTQYVLMAATNIEDKSYPFSGQDVMTIIMARHLGQMFGRVQDEILAKVREQPGDDLREQMQNYVTAEAALLGSSEQENPQNEGHEELNDEM